MKAEIADGEYWVTLDREWNQLHRDDVLTISGLSEGQRARFVERDSGVVLTEGVEHQQDGSVTFTAFRKMWVKGQVTGILT